MLNIKLYYLVIYTLLALAISLPAFATETDIIDGGELYHDYCSVCHGDKGDGNSRAKGGLSTKPRDFTQAGLSKVLTREYMVTVLLDGRPGTAMVGWSSRLSRQQAENTIDYIRSNFMSQTSSDKPTAAKPDTKLQQTFMQQSLMNGLTGNYDQGKLFYDDNCATCHGLTGAGDGPRAYFIFPKPRNFLSETSRMRLNREVLFNATKYGLRGKEMPAWGKVISDQEIANVVEYVFQSMIQTEKTTASTK